MSIAAGPVASPVLLVLGGTVSQAAIYRAAELADGAPVTVLGTGAESEQLRRAVAQAMSALQKIGVTAFGQVSLTASPGRTVARLARASGAKFVVLDRCPGDAAAVAVLSAELRRRMYGCGVSVVTTAARRPAREGALLPGRRGT
jgi:hypothetical protein